MAKITKTDYYIENENISKTIALLTDIHYYKPSNMKKLNKIVDYLHNEKFDYICIVGDFLDVGTVKEINPFITWIKELARLKKVFISIGGHDIVRDKHIREYYYNEELYDKLKQLDNVILLDNEAYVEDGIRFIGLTLPLDFYYKYKENTNYFMRYVNNTFEAFNDDNYNILLCHTPLPLTKIKNYDDIRLMKNIPLVLSGHTHGGIVPKKLRGIMKGRGFFSPHKGQKFPKDSYGLVKRENTEIIISTGITKASHSNPFSFLDNLFDSEITFVNIKRKF